MNETKTLLNLFLQPSPCQHVNAKIYKTMLSILVFVLAISSQTQSYSQEKSGYTLLVIRSPIHKITDKKLTESINAFQNADILVSDRLRSEQIEKSSFVLQLSRPRIVVEKQEGDFQTSTDGKTSFGAVFRRQFKTVTARGRFSLYYSLPGSKKRKRLLQGLLEGSSSEVRLKRGLISVTTDTLKKEATLDSIKNLDSRLLIAFAPKIISSRFMDEINRAPVNNIIQLTQFPSPGFAPQDDRMDEAGNRHIDFPLHNRLPVTASGKIVLIDATVRPEGKNKNHREYLEFTLEPGEKKSFEFAIARDKRIKLPRCNLWELQLSPP